MKDLPDDMNVLGTLEGNMNGQDFRNSHVCTLFLRGLNLSELKSYGRVGGVKYMIMEGDLTLGGEYIIQYTADVLQNSTLETYIILSSSVTPINLIQLKKSCDSITWEWKAIVILKFQFFFSWESQNLRFQH